MNTAARRCIRDCPRRICYARLCVVVVILDWCIWSDVYMHVVHCWYVIMNCLGIWIITWVWYLSGKRGLDCWAYWYYWLCYVVDILSLVMTDWSGLSRRICFVDSVSFVYMVTGEFPYAWPSDLFRSTLCRWCILLYAMISLTGR